MNAHLPPRLRPWGLALLLLPVAAPALEVKVSNPDFTVTVPDLPALPLEAAPAAASAPAAPRLVASDGTTRMALTLSPSGRPVSPRDCAGTGLRAILAQPGMPGRDSVYRAPLNVTTFLVLYRLGDGPQPVLHAHLLSAVASTHCADVHFSRAGRDGEDQDAWRRTFTGARIEDVPR